MQKYRLVDEDHNAVAEGEVADDVVNYAVRHDDKLYTWSHIEYPHGSSDGTDVLVETPHTVEHSKA